MLRVVLAVALSTALLGVVTPALEDARTTRTEEATARELDRVASTAERLAHEESPGARRTLSVSLPGESPTAAPLAFVSLGGVPDGEAADGPTDAWTAATDTSGRDLLAYGIAGGAWHVERVGVELRVVRDGRRAASDSEALVLDGGATYRLTLRLVRIRGQRTVLVGVDGPDDCCPLATTGRGGERPTAATTSGGASDGPSRPVESNSTYRHQ